MSPQEVCETKAERITYTDHMQHAPSAVARVMSVAQVHVKDTQRHHCTTHEPPQAASCVGEYHCRQPKDAGAVWANLMQWAGLEGSSHLGSVGLRHGLHPLLDLARLHGEQLAEQLRRLQVHTT